MAMHVTYLWRTATLEDVTWAHTVFEDRCDIIIPPIHTYSLTLYGRDMALPDGDEITIVLKTDEDNLLFALKYPEVPWIHKHQAFGD